MDNNKNTEIKKEPTIVEIKSTSYVKKGDYTGANRQVLIDSGLLSAPGMGRYRT